MILRECKQVIKFFIAAVRFDIHDYLDLLIADRHSVVECQQALYIDAANKLRRQAFDPDATYGRMKYRRRRHTTSQCVEQEFDRVCTFVVAK